MLLKQKETFSSACNISVQIILQLFMFWIDLKKKKKEMLFIHAFELHIFINFLTNCCEGLWLNNKEPVLFRLPSG